MKVWVVTTFRGQGGGARQDRLRGLWGASSVHVLPGRMQFAL